MPPVALSSPGLWVLGEGLGQGSPRLGVVSESGVGWFLPSLSVDSLLFLLDPGQASSLPEAFPDLLRPYFLLHVAEAALCHYQVSAGTSPQVGGGIGSRGDA